MEQEKFANILQSPATLMMKRKVINDIIAAVSHQKRDSFHNMLAFCIQNISESDNEFTYQSSIAIYKQWATHNISYFVDFCDVAVVTSLLSDTFLHPEDAIWLLHTSLDLIRHSGSTTYDQLCCVVCQQASDFVRSHPYLTVVTSFCSMLLGHVKCIPADDEAVWFCSSLLAAVVTFVDPPLPDKLKDYMVSIQNSVGQLLHQVWQQFPITAQQSSEEIFGLISEPGGSSLGLGFIAQLVPTDLMTASIRQAVINSSVNEQSLMIALCAMIDWLRWWPVTDVHCWISSFIQCLVSAQKYSTLMEVTETRIEQLFVGLKYAQVREQCFTVTERLLLGYRYSPHVFHSIIPIVPDIIAQLLHEIQNSQSVAAEILPKLVDMLHCLMFLHSGFPDLYQPLIAAIRFCHIVYPTEVMMCGKLNQFAWVSTSNQVGFQVALLPGGYRPLESRNSESRSETGLTGLCNLGNTCYMNSVLQALFMCCSFRWEVLLSKPSDDELMLTGLQRVFAFLAFTMRPAWNPEQFFKDSKPPWFIADVQHDCSEFLKYLLDQLHEQQSSSNHSNQHSTLTNSQQSITIRTQQSVIGAKKKPKSVKKLRKFFHSFSSLKRSVDNHKVVVSSTAVLPNLTLIERTFGGEIVCVCKCLKCNVESIKTETFTDLALAFPVVNTAPGAVVPTVPGHGTSGTSGTCDTILEPSQLICPATVDGPRETVKLESMLEHYLRREKLDGNNRYYCEHCCTLQDAERQVVISSAPPTLVLSLLRFAYNAQTGSHCKICTDVSYPQILQLPVTPHSSSTSHSTHHGLSGKSSKAVHTAMVVDYILTAVIVHSGLSSDGGHYYCYAASHTNHKHNMWKNTTALSTRTCTTQTSSLGNSCSQWFMFNDERVTYTTFETIQQLTHNFSRDTAYVLFYDRTLAPPSDSGNTADNGRDLEQLKLPLNVQNLIEEDNKQYQQEYTVKCQTCQAVEAQSQEEVEQDLTNNKRQFETLYFTDDSESLHSHINTIDYCPVPDYN